MRALRPGAAAERTRSARSASRVSVRSTPTRRAARGGRQRRRGLLRLGDRASGHSLGVGDLRCTKPMAQGLLGAEGLRGLQDGARALGADLRGEAPRAEHEAEAAGPACGRSPRAPRCGARRRRTGRRRRRSSCRARAPACRRARGAPTAAAARCARSAAAGRPRDCASYAAEVEAGAEVPAVAAQHEQARPRCARPRPPRRAAPRPASADSAFILSGRFSVSVERRAGAFDEELAHGCGRRRCRRSANTSSLCSPSAGGSRRIGKPLPEKRSGEAKVRVCAPEGSVMLLHPAHVLHLRVRRAPRSSC